MRAPQLFETLRAFCLGSFRALLSDLERGADLPFAFEEHNSYDRPALYEYRPLVKPFIEARAHVLRRRPDAQLAVDELQREPAAAIFARAHAGPRADEHEALFGSVLLPLLMSTAESCGGFDWDDSAFARAFAELEEALFGEGHQYGALAPLIGLTTGGATIELGNGIRIRTAATGELAKLWPEANGLLPTDFGREPDRLCVLELERALDAGATEPPDAPGELADAVTAIRLATAAPIAAGPVLFERLDWRPYGVRPVLPIAATQPAGGTDAARLVPRRPGARSPPAPCAGRRRSGARRSARSLGAVAVPGRPVPGRTAARGARRAARRLRRLGPRRARRDLLGETPRGRAELQDRLSGDPVRTQSDARSSRRCSTATAQRL